MDGTEPDELRNRRIPAKQIRKLREKLTSLSLAERLRIPGMEPRRGDLAVAGSVILDTILRELGAEDITLCDLALREGLVLDYIHRHRTEIARADRYPDVRRRSVVELGERCNYFAQHAAQVSRLALSMFEQTRGVHGLKDKEREWLEYAALLHDVGVHISYDKHHRHSYYLIKHGDLRGFDPQEIEVIGLIARYHRRAPPKKGHPGYGELPSDLRKAVKVLSSIVRLAEGLDRSHVQVLDSVSLANRGDDYLMQLRTNGDAELELWAAGRHVEPFEDMLGKPVRFEVAPAPTRAKRAPARAEKTPAAPIASSALGPLSGEAAPRVSEASTPSRVARPVRAKRALRRA
jgi:exopolyphosphatase/guanosine-5'-triphosphate,3'-diphosphate pyrophosphatase